MSTLKKLYDNTVKKQMEETFKYDNVHQIPRIEKIILHRGLGEAITNSKVVDLTYQQFYNITGNKPLLTKAKKSISNFKLRENVVIGCKITLRADKMYDFLTKLLNIALPKIRDFRGVQKKSFDGRGNFNMGIKEDLIFPEISDQYEKIDKARGLDVTIVTSAKTDKEAKELLTLMGMPFEKQL